MFNHRLRRKFQDSSTKHQTKLSSQATKTVGTRRAHLEFGAWSLFGSWSLELGISRRNASRWHRPRTRRVAVNAVPANVRFSSGALAQLVRAPPCHGGGCGFEPRRLRGDHLLDRSLGFFGLAVTFCGSRSALTAQPLLMTMFCREKSKGQNGCP